MNICPDTRNMGLTRRDQVVYIPPGTYEISKTINLRTDTILMGDATDVRRHRLSKLEPMEILANHGRF